MKSEAQITLDEIFHAACALAPAERQRYLDEVCAGDDALRRKVEALLEHDDPESTFLENPALENAAKEMAFAARPSVTSKQPMIGRQIENYRVQALLGKGGMGEVYLARDLELDVDVAIKFLPAAYADDPEWQARFKREARLIAALKHPNITAIHRNGESEGRPFLVFEYVPGVTLEEKLKPGPLSPSDVLPLATQLAAALECAHQNGIIHRDLKPANIKITPDGQLKVLDFGIAKRISADVSTIELTVAQAADHTDELTRDFGDTRKGEVVGTVSYMSPEQTRGERLDARTDLWALGCVLYESLTGRRPFKGIDTYDTLNTIRTGQPDWQALPPRTPKPLRELLRRCLEKDPRQRLRSAADARQTCERLLNPSRFWPQQLKHQVALLTGAAILVVCALLAGAWLRSWWTRSALPVEKQLVVLPFKGFADDQAGAGFAEELRRNLLSLATDVRAAQPSELQQANFLNLDLQSLPRKLGVSLIVGGDVQPAGDQIRVRFWVRNRFLYEVAQGELIGPRQSLAELQYRIAEQLTQDLKLAKSARAARFSEHLKLSHADASEQYLIAIGELQKDLNRDSVEKPIEILTRLIQSEGDSARFEAALAQAYLRKYLFTETPEWAEKALAACAQAMNLAPDQPELYRVTRGLVYTEFGKYKEAVEDFQTALASAPNNWEALRGLAWAYELSGQLPQAEQAYAQAVNQWPNFWVGYNEWGAFYAVQGRYAKAIEKWQQVANLLPDSPTGHNNLAVAYFQTGQDEQALQAYLRSLEKDSTQDNTEAFAGLGTIYFYRGQYDEALRYYQRGIALAQQAGKQDAVLLGNRADAYRQLARAQSLPNLVEEYQRRANDSYAEAINLYRQRIAKQIEDAQGLSSLAEWLAKSGQRDEALKTLRTALQANAQNVEVAYSAAVVFLLAGEVNQSLTWLENAACNGYGIARLQRDPELSPLRADARFQPIINKCQLRNQ